MRFLQNLWLPGFVPMLGVALVAAGCYSTPVDTSEYAQGPVPLRQQSPAREAEACKSYEDSLTGGQVFSMYCSSCHNAPALSERPFANFKNVSAHMRVIANLTGKEQAKLEEFFQRWHDVPPSPPPVAPSPKVLTFSQPVSELRDQKTPPPALGNPGIAPDDRPAP